MMIKETWIAFWASFMGLAITLTQLEQIIRVTAGAIGVGIALFTLLIIIRKWRKQLPEANCPLLVDGKCQIMERERLQK